MNNKIYIGKTKRTEKARFYQHITSAFNKNSHIYNTPLNRAIRKYGEKSFIIEIIDTANSLEELDEKEKFYISSLDCKIHSGCGYNVKEGSEKSYNISDKTRYKLSNHGRPQSENTKRLISERNSKQIVCLNNGMIFKNSKSCSEYFTSIGYKMDAGDIRKVTNGMVKHLKTFVFMKKLDLDKNNTLIK